MARTEAQRRATKKWNDAHMGEVYDRITILVPKGRKPEIEEYAKTKGYNAVSGYLNSLVRTDMGYTLEEWKRPANS